MEPSKTPKKEPRKILRRSKTLKENPDRFSGGGVDFRAKIIGTERVVDARGNRMCQGALQRLKAAVKASGEHKQRILLNISLDGIILKDEKLGTVLHHHPIHKISFISQDTADSRAFGYVFGCPQNGHDFFAIKTDKMASQVVLTLRDLFLTALDLKKKEMDEKPEEETVTATENGKCEEDAQPPAVDTLLDLQFSMDSLKQGISHMDQSINRGFGFSLSEDDASDSVPFHFKIDKLSSLYHETLSLSSRSSSTSECKDHSEPHEDRYAVFLEDIDALPSVFDNPPEPPTTHSPPKKALPSEPTSRAWGSADPFHGSPKKSPNSKPTLVDNSLQDFFQLSPKKTQQAKQIPVLDSVETPKIADTRPIDFFRSSPKKAPYTRPLQNEVPKNVGDASESFFRPPPNDVLPTESPPSKNLKRVDYHLEDIFHISPKKPPPEKPASEAPRTVDSPQEHFFRAPPSDPPPTRNPFAPPVLPPKKCPFPEEDLPWDRNPFSNPFEEDLPPPSSPPPPPPPPRLPPNSPPPPRPPGRPAPLSWASFGEEDVPPLPSPARKKTFGASEEEFLGRKKTFSSTEEDAPVPPLLPPKKPSDSSSACASASSNGTRSSSSLVFSSSEGDSQKGSCGEPLVSSWDGDAASPDSIFRRKGDPFADDFFLTLSKRSANEGFKS